MESTEEQVLVCRHKIDGHELPELASLQIVMDSKSLGWIVPHEGEAVVSIKKKWMDACTLQGWLCFSDREIDPGAGYGLTIFILHFTS